MTPQEQWSTVRALIAQGLEARPVLADFIRETCLDEVAIADLVAKLQVCDVPHYAKNFPGLEPPVYSAMKAHRSQRFVRIVSIEHWNRTPSRRVVCFVERETGLIWKAATFKAPALNFPRGNVFLLPEKLENTSVDSWAGREG